jgi:sigma-B regulation protein RsbU (phosphoserine phosphatase)
VTAGVLNELADWLALKDRALDVAAEGITIADARLPDRPLVYVNRGFERMTGYAVSEVLGRNCRFLQGTASDTAAVAEIRSALADGRECLVEILNHRKDGTPFWNRLSITPLRDPSGQVTHFIGIQSDVTARRQAEDGLRQAKQSLERDLRLAARVQQALLPPPEIQAGELRIAHAFLPCDDLAGDGVGIVSLPGNRLGIYLLDVSGHGVAAALLSFTLTHLLSPTMEGSLLTESTGTGMATISPSRVAARLNRQFPMDRTRQFFTLIYGNIDPASGRFQYAMAGHPAPLLLPHNGTPAPVAGAGLPIGVVDDAAYDDETLTLQPGDRLYCYTDGIIEAFNAQGEAFGQSRLLAEIAHWRARPLRAGLDGIAAAVRAWSDGPIKDDISLLAIERAR